MSQRETIQCWHEACLAFDAKDYTASLELFQRCPEQLSKILYNQAIVLIALDRVVDAVQALSDAIQKDNHFAMAYFQRSCLYFLCQQYEEVCSCMTPCILLSVHTKCVFDLTIS
eukprot:m.37532 g.37532  ORF g.37532 m.37532 type:complete len:114 (-) comp10107_c0_seq1:1607-1948(-)